MAVTALPDPKRGERLFVLYSPEMTVSPGEVVARLQAAELPRIWVPSAEDFVPVDAIPILGTGKVDLRKLKELAAECRSQGIKLGFYHSQDQDWTAPGGAALQHL